MTWRLWGERIAEVRSFGVEDSPLGCFDNRQRQGREFAKEKAEHEDCLVKWDDKLWKIMNGG